MTLRLNDKTRIDNLRNYPAEVVEKLRGLLTAGAKASLDPHRHGFYQVENGSRMFYIHICPSGSVWLLASWQKPAPMAAEVGAVLSAARS